MNRSNIEFCDYTWNPIVGCNIGCSYCYARRFATRFSRNPDFVPTFFPTRLDEPSKVQKPAKIFVCSMADIFSPGVCIDWIDQIIAVIRKNPHHTFQMLTKRPIGYRGFDWPQNVWLGTSIEEEKHAKRIELLSSCGCKHMSFALVEPLMGPMHNVDFSGIDMLYVGAMTGPGAVVPQQEWIASIKHHNIVWKENIKKYLEAA